jgi:hypothetical protein
VDSSMVNTNHKVIVFIVSHSSVFMSVARESMNKLLNLLKFLPARKA